MAARVLLPKDLFPYLKNILRHSDAKKHNALNIGVCVSGGPDSMALAYLLSKLQTKQPNEFRLFALIVDHRARPESTDEAEQVGHNLSMIGVKSTVLTMDWPSGIHPLQLSDFESQARTKRYELLANTARRKHIRHLFLGHHQDDQVETILMRLIRNHNLSLNGLAGMASHASLPAAFNVFGTHVEDRGVPLSARVSLPPGSSMFESEEDSQYSKQFKIAMPGGISMERPLLSFKKADLVATCESNKIPYVVDPTNKDPQSSLRNAVRYLRTHYKLPKALDGKRLLRMQQKAQRHVDHVKKKGDTVLSTCSITALDLRSGVMKVTLPVWRKGSIDSAANAFALCKLGEVVTPNIRVNHNTLTPARHTSQFFKKHNFEHAKVSSTQVQPNFTFDGVQFSLDPQIPNSWILHRQPMKESEVLENTLNFTLDLYLRPKRGLASKFLLWDNRFWIRVYTSGDVLPQLQVRPHQKNDLTNVDLSKDLDLNNPEPGIRGLLGDAAKDKIRYTLPVLTFRDRPVAFPTLRYRIAHNLLETKIRYLEWDVLYNSFSLLNRLSEPSE